MILPQPNKNAKHNFITHDFFKVKIYMLAAKNRFLKMDCRVTLEKSP
jgi:hypothetical protein